MSCSRDVFQLRKDHKFDEALATARECYAADPNDIWNQRAYGWVLYDFIKQAVEAFEAKREQPGQLANRLGALLGEYRQFGENVRPDLLHSQLLTQVLKASRVWQGFLDFARWWGPGYFRAEDKQPYTPPEGREVPSLAIRYVYAVGWQVTHGATEVEPGLRAWAEAQVDEALQALQDDQWLHYYKSRMLLKHGEIPKARRCLLTVVRRQQRAAWVWTLLGQTHESQDPTKAITCYFHAVRLAREAQEVANTRITLAGLLATQQRFEEATVQVRLAVEVGFSSGDAHPVNWRKSDAQHIEGFATQMTGSVSQRDGQAFGFMKTSEGERVFIYPALIAELAESLGPERTCLAVMGKDKKGKQGWRALRWVVPHQSDKL